MEVTQFEAAWKEGRRPRLEDHVPAEASRRAALLPALVRVDLVQRLQCGESVRVETYLSCYPELQKNRDAVLTLIAAEFSQCKGTLAEYKKRFPQYAGLLPAALNAPASPDPWGTFVGQPVTPEAPKIDDARAPTADFSSLAPEIPAASKPERPPEARPQPRPSDTLSLPPGALKPVKPPVPAKPVAPESKSSKPSPTDAWPAFDSLRLSDDAPKAARAEAPTDKDGPKRASATPADAPTEKNRDPAPECTGAFVPASNAAAGPDRTGRFTPGMPPPLPLPPGTFPPSRATSCSPCWSRRHGVVYRPRTSNQTSGRPKMISPVFTPASRICSAFRTEAEAVARLQHPNIVQIHEIGNQDNQPFFSLEFVDGGALDRKLAGKPQPVLEAATMLETLADAMKFAHARGVIHRDLKPANVLLTKDGQPKITDFGLAKQTDSVQGQTETGSVAGTPPTCRPSRRWGYAKPGPRGGHLFARHSVRVAHRQAAVPRRDRDGHADPGADDGAEAAEQLRASAAIWRRSA